MKHNVRLLAGAILLCMIALAFAAPLTIYPDPILPNGESVAYYLKALNKSIVESLPIIPAQATTPAQTSASPTSVLPTQPLLSAACIDKILEKSPAKGFGIYFVQYGEEYGVDPAFALAMFRQENSLCNSDVAGSANFKGCLNKSISNIICTTSSCYEGFNTYSSWQDGIKAFYNQLKNGSFYIKAGNTTVETIYPKWANVSIDSVNVQHVKDFLVQYRAQAKTC